MRILLAINLDRSRHDKFITSIRCTELFMAWAK